MNTDENAVFSNPGMIHLVHLGWEREPDWFSLADAAGGVPEIAWYETGGNLCLCRAIIEVARDHPPPLFEGKDIAGNVYMRPRQIHKDCALDDSGGALMTTIITQH